MLDALPLAPTLLLPQVSLAVLLDNFITASANMELEEKEKETDRFLREKQANNPLDPLLIMARIFPDTKSI